VWRNVTIAGSSARTRALVAAAFAAPLIALAISLAAGADDAVPIAEATSAAAGPAAGASIAAIASPAAASSPAAAPSVSADASPAAAPSLASPGPAPSTVSSPETSRGSSALVIAAPPADAAPPANMVDTPLEQAAVPPSTEEIPSTAEIGSQQGAREVSAPAPAATSSEPYNPEIARYQEEQNGISNPQQLRSLEEFMSEGEITSPIGIGLREARRRLVTGQEVDGLLVVEVKTGSPAADAGLHASSKTKTAKSVMTVIAMAASVAVMPPAVLLVPLIDAMPEPYDMIIGVDGTRVSNFLDFQDRMQNLKPGETVYLSVVRDGRRMQIAVPVPKNAALNTY
jgi:hypothetical protein